MDIFLDREEPGGPVLDGPAVTDQLGQLIDPFRGDARDGPAVHQDGGALIAHTGTGGGIHQDEAVFRRLAALHPETAAQSIKQFEITDHAIGDAVGEQHPVATGSLEVQKTVETGHADDARPRQPEPLRHPGERRRGQPALDLLSLHQNLQQRGRSAAIAFRNSVDLGQCFVHSGASWLLSDPSG